MGYHYLRGLTHEQWLEQRTKGIGSSEVGTILGVNKYETPLELWMKKTGRLPAKQMTEAMDEGHLLEPSVAEFFARETGCTIKRNSAGDWLAVDNDRDYLRVSPDRLYWEPGARHCPRNYCIVECKTTALDVDPESPPPYWLLQLQYQMGVMGVKHGALSWLSTAFRFHHGYRLVPFDEMFYKEELIPRLDYFWNENVLKDVAPTPKLEEELKLAYPLHTEGLSVQADDTTLDAWKEIKELKKEQAEYKKKLDSLQERESMLHTHIKAVMKDAESILGPDGKVLATWKTAKDSEKFDMDRFRSENDELYKRYLHTERGSRRFSVK